MSGVLDKHIAKARLKLQERLKEHLAEVDGLPVPVRSEIEAEIGSMKIATFPQLSERVINIFVQKIDDEFNDVVKEVSRKHGFSQHILADSQTKERLLQDLKSDLTKHAKDELLPLTFTLARDKAVKHLYRQRVDLVSSWVKWWSGVDRSIAGRRFLEDGLNKLRVPSNLKGITVENIGGELSREILADPRDVASIESEEDVKAIVLNKLSALLKPRIEQARLESQEKLYRRVREAKLPHDDNINLQDKIAMFEITTMEQLEQAIKDSAIVT